MATTRKKPTDGGVRVESASDKPNRARVAAGQTARAASAEPVWSNPKDMPPAVTEKLLAESEAARKPSPSIVVEAKALAGINGDPNIVAAIIIAHALDRLGEKIIQAAAVGRYRPNGP